MHYFGSMEEAPEPRTYLVFAQPDDAAMPLAALAQHARRFFDAELVLGNDDRITIVARGGEPATRRATTRPAEAADLAAAQAFELRVCYTGLADLAKRCPTVWLISCERGDDRVALLLAAIVASVVLGPILSPERDELFGVKTARLKLEKATRPG